LEVIYDEIMKAKAEYVEGTEAWTRFQSAVTTILSVPKSAVPNPFTKPKPKKKRTTARKS